MNDNLNTNTFKAVPAPVAPLTDAEFKRLLETRPDKSLDGEVVAYVTDADEASDEPTTVH